MNGVWIVTRREIVERKLTFLAALALGLIPIILSLIPGPLGESMRNGDIRLLVGLVLAAIVAASAAVLFGGNTIVRALTERRLSFYFSRPLAANAIWAGKLLAAIGLALAGGVLAGAPSLLIEAISGSGHLLGDALTVPFAGFVFVAVALLVLAAHVASSIARLRTPWVALDVLLFVMLIGAFSRAVGGLLGAGFWDLLDARDHPVRYLWPFAVVALLILIAASYVQVADGRTDVRRSHGALSATLWSLTAIFVAALTGLDWWVASATPSDLVAIEDVTAAPRGGWIEVEGTVRSRGSAHPSFLYDTVTGRSVKAAHPWKGFVFSRDATRVAWFESTGVFPEGRSESSLRLADLSVPTPRVVESDLTLGGVHRFALSPSGRRLAVLADEKSLAVYDLVDPAHVKQVVAVKIPVTGTTPALHFFEEDRVRLLPRIRAPGSKSRIPSSDQILELDIPARKLRPTGGLDADSLPNLRSSEDGSRLIGVRENRVTLRDGSTGAVLATLSQELRSAKARFLSGDRIALVGLSAENAILKVFDGFGRETLSIVLGPARTALLGGESAEARLSIGLNPLQASDEHARGAWRTVFVDPKSGEVALTAEGLVPADRWSSFFSPVLPPAEAATETSKLFLDSSSRLVHFDPATGDRKVLLGGNR